jgi:hypothetical protein
LRRHQHQHVPSEPGARLRGAPAPLCTRETTPLRASDFAGRRQRDAGPSCGSCRGPVSRLADPSRTTAGMPYQPLLLTGLRSLASAPAASACPAPAAALLAGLRSSASASASGGCPVPPPLCSPAYALRRSCRPRDDSHSGEGDGMRDGYFGLSGGGTMGRKTGTVAGCAGAD